MCGRSICREALGFREGLRGFGGCDGERADAGCGKRSTGAKEKGEQW